MNNYGEIKIPSLAFDRRKVTTSECFVAIPSNSCVVLYSSVSMVFDDLWSFRQSGFCRNYGLWNWAHEKSTAN